MEELEKMKALIKYHPEPAVADYYVKKVERLVGDGKGSEG